MLRGWAVLIAIEFGLKRWIRERSRSLRQYMKVR
jgi:hypothetical protein